MRFVGQDLAGHHVKKIAFSTRFIRSDNAGEYTSVAFDQNGRVEQHSPQQNDGSVERKIKRSSIENRL